MSKALLSGNEALAIELAGPPANPISYKDWSDAYRWHANAYPSCLVCRAITVPELANPPVVSEDLFAQPFPNTRSPKQLTAAEFAKLRRLLEKSFT